MDHYQTLRYNQAAFKTSHNSYDRDESLNEQLQFYQSSADYYNCGCRGIELDIWRHSQSNPDSAHWFTVNHLTNGGDDLSSYLMQLQEWHQQNPNHDIVEVILDIKSSGGDASTFPEEIDRYLTNFMGRNLILSPGDLFSGIDGHNLSNLVKAQGWPALSAMTGKFLFCLSGTEEWKKLYSETAPAARLCFADATDPNQLKAPSSRVIYNVKSGKSDPHTVRDLLSGNILIRVYDVDSEKDWQQARQIGANILATNKVSDHHWAAVSTQEPYSPYESNK